MRKQYQVLNSCFMAHNLATAFPRIVHDAGILRSKTIFEKAEGGEILVAPEDVIENVRVVP